MVKDLKPIVFLIVCFTFLSVSSVYAQYRANENEFDLKGNVVKPEHLDHSSLGNLKDGFLFQMKHNYSMNFGSIGGQYTNLNVYTNSMYFRFNEKVDAQVDLSVFHSPFGGINTLNSFNGSSNDLQFAISNAQVNYKINDNMSIHLGFRQLPSNYYGYDRGYYDPMFDFNRGYFGNYADRFYRSSIFGYGF